MVDVSPPIIELDRVTRVYGAERGISDASLILRRGEICAIIGGNGSGKSTLLHCAAGFAPLDSGVVRIAGAERFTATNVSRPICAPEAVCIFQDSQPWPHLSVLDNVMLALARTRRLSPAAALQRARAALAQVGLEDRERSNPRSLSGGLKQRLTWARALAVEPSVLFVDEGTSALDPDWVENIRHLLRTYAGQGGAAFIIAHQMGFVRRCADKVAFLHHGRIHEFGEPSMLSKPLSAELGTFLQNA